VGDGASGGDDGASTTLSEPPGDADLRNDLGLEYPDYELEDSLTIFQWTNYWPEQTVDNFEQAFDVSVTVERYDSMSEMRANLDASRHDLVFPADWAFPSLVSNDRLAPLDLNKLPNWSNLADRWVETAPYDTGPKRHSAPYQWGTSGIAWNAEMIDTEEIDAWDAMWNEAYDGQMTMLDSQRETIGAALKKLGYSLNSQTQSEIREAKAELLRQKELLMGYDTTNMISNLTDQQASPVHTWSGESTTAYWNTYSDGSSPIHYRIPESGGVQWIDAAAVTKGARHPNAAHAFINYFLSARVGAAITNYNYYGSPNAAAEEHIKDAVLNNPSVYPDEETLERLEFVRDVGEANQYYADAWEEIKNA
jgi:spermidine/putrescine transport system substrate-binding protein